jgi:Homeodomain-like domain
MTGNAGMATAAARVIERALVGREWLQLLHLFVASAVSNKLLDKQNGLVCRGFMPRSAPVVSLSLGDQEEIQGWLTAQGTPQQVVLRGRIVLAAAEGRSDRAIACQLQVNRHTVTLWRQRFLQEGKESLWEVAPGRGRKATYGPEKIQAVVKATLQSKPKGMTQWSCRLMAKNQGLSKSTVSNIWRSHNLKPHQVQTFKLSRDPQFLEKLTDPSDSASTPKSQLTR